MSECKRKDPHMRDFVEWVISRVLFHDMRLNEAKFWFDTVGVPEPVFDRLFARAGV